VTMKKESARAVLIAGAVLLLLGLFVLPFCCRLYASPLDTLPLRGPAENSALMEENTVRWPYFLAGLVLGAGLYLCGLVPREAKPLTALPALLLGLVWYLCLTPTPILWEEYGLRLWQYSRNFSLLAMALCGALLVAMLDSVLVQKARAGFDKKRALLYAGVLLFVLLLDRPCHLAQNAAALQNSAGYRLLYYVLLLLPALGAQFMLQRPASKGLGAALLVFGLLQLCFWLDLFRPLMQQDGFVRSLLGILGGSTLPAANMSLGLALIGLAVRGLLPKKAQSADAAPPEAKEKSA